MGFHTVMGRLLLALAASAMPAGLAIAQSPAVGDVQKLKAITFSLQVGNMHKDTKRVTYSPPPGWYVRSHFVECTGKHGNVTFSVSTVPHQWGWSSDERTDESKKVMLESGAEAHKVGGQARVKHHQTYKVNELQSVRASHHALVLDVTAKGEGFLKSGAGIELTIVAELVYIGTEEPRVSLELTAGSDRAVVELKGPVAVEQ